MPGASERLNVLYLVECLYADAGGGTEKQFLELYRLHDRIGVEPHVAFLADAPVYATLPWAKPPVVLHLTKMRSLRLFRAIGELSRFIREQRVTVVHTFFDHAAILGVLLKLLRPRLRVITTLRNMGHEHGALRRRLMGRVFNRSDAVLVNAAAIREKLVRVYAVERERVHVIYNLPLEPDRRDGSPADPQFDAIRNRHGFLAAVVSNLRDVKGISDVIAAAAALRNLTDFGIVVIGGGERREVYQRMIDEQGLAGTVHLLGYRADIRPYLARANLAILASHSEGQSNALIEYTLAGLPIVATDVGGNPEVLMDGQCGILVPPQRPDQLAQAVLRLYQDAEQRRMLATRAREQAQRRFSREVILGAYRVLYGSLQG